MTIDRSSQLIAEAIATLAAAGVDSPGIDAEAMLAAASFSSRVAIVAGLAKIDEAARARYAAMVSRRARREPLAYILGRKEFFSLDLEVTPAVLIPRPETETIVNSALEFLADHPDARVLDMGTGSGAIALAIAANTTAAKVTATDISSDALAIAGANASHLGLAARMQFRVTDCFEPLDSLGRLGRFDLIVSNPPYVKNEEFDGLAPEICHYEPRIALSGGADGLDFYRRIVPMLSDHLEKHGAAIFEIGAEQSGPVAEILRSAGSQKIDIIPDLAGVSRVVVGYFG